LRVSVWLMLLPTGRLMVELLLVLMYELSTRSLASIHVKLANSGLWFKTVWASRTKLLLLVSRLAMSRAIRMICSCLSSIRTRRRCCAYSTSRRTTSCSRLISSYRKYQNAVVIAAINSTTAASGAIKAKRSWRLGVCLCHQVRQITSSGCMREARVLFCMWLEFIRQ